ncbi:MAG: anti-sigma factor antagonist [Selenomonadaceae bacterium]|nr:anti-sigma factor antagonist [Selenomonadaceae bacterium]
MKTSVQDNLLTIFFEGEINAKNVPALQKEINEIISANLGREILFDADALTYISSAGLRLLLATQNKMGKTKLTVRNVSKDVYEIFDMTKFTSLMNIEKKMREISIEGAEIVGKGRSSTVYRIDPETIVKLYTAGVPLPKIKQEIDLAKKAFVVGIPTPISYDLVTCDKSYGVVFEMLGDADTVGRSITSHMDEFDEITRKFVDTYKIIHQTDIKEMGGFNSLKDTWHSWADGMNSDDGFDSHETESLHKLIDTIPDRSTMVHCDYHAGNVMYQKGEIVVIDMADIGYGHPIFDLAGNAFHARYSGSETRQKVHGMNQENMLRFYNTLLAIYFDTQDEERLADIKTLLDAFGLLRGALFPRKHVQIAPELKAFHVEETRKNLFPRLDDIMKVAGRIDEFFR